MSADTGAREPHSMHLADERIPHDVLAYRVTAIENFVAQMHKSATAPRTEAILRRVLWAIRGTNDEPPEPDDG